MTLVIKGSQYRWPSTIRYKFDSSVTASMKSKIRETFDVYERLTQARFKEDDNATGGFLKFQRDDNITGCGDSHVGFSGEEVPINLKGSCDKGTVMHEVGHALGLHHEHQRPDRDYYVRVIEDNIEAGEEHNFERKRPDKVVAYGDYDYDSIMHYPADAFNKNWGANIEPRTSHPIGQRDHFSAGDLFGIRRLLPSNAHVSRLNDNGRIGLEATRYDWTEGWTVVRFFRLWVTDYLFMLKTSDGTVHINQMEGDGTVGRRVDTQDWHSGWTLVEFFRNGSDTFMLTLKKETGEAHINKINGDGTIGGRVATYDWGEGWTAACFYSILGTDYGLFFKRGSGVVHVNKMDGGRVREKVYDGELPGPGWRTALHFTQWQNNFVFFLKDAGARVSEITWDGKVGRVIENYSGWTDGWTHAVIYDRGGRKNLLTLKSGSGTVHVNTLDDGKIGARTETHEWTGGWNNIAVMDNRYLMWVKEFGRAGMI